MFRKAALILSVSLCTATFSQAAEPPSQPPPKIKPSFDCTNVKLKWKIVVCGDETLAALDAQEDALLRRARIKAVTPDAVNAEQDLWVSERDACTSAGCLTVAYRRRIRELHNWTN
jgi:uncharacterized protein